MAYTPNLQIKNGGFTDFEGAPLNAGYLLMVLSHDEQYSVGPNQVVGGIKLRVPLDSNGNIPVSPATKVWSNDVLSPAGSFYTVRAFKSDGTEAWAAPQFWTLTASPSVLDVGTIIPTNPPGGGLGSGTGLLLETNGVQNTDQSLLNIAQGTNVTITNVAGTTTINAASGGSSFSTAGQGYFLGGQSFAPISDDTGHQFGTANNRVVAVQLNLESSYVISSLACMCITAKGSACLGTAALYTADGNTKLIDAGANAFDLGTSSQKYENIILGSPVTITHGTYLFAWGATTTGGSVLCHELMTWFTSMINGIDATNPQVTPTRYGICANSLSAGAMPATLGALTPLDHTDPINIPVILFKV